MSDQDVTLGELFRLCQRIEVQVIKTNGRVTVLETEVAVLQDRHTTEATNIGKDRTARNTGLGAIVAAAGSLLWSWWKG